MYMDVVHNDSGSFCHSAVTYTSVAFLGFEAGLHEKCIITIDRYTIMQYSWNNDG